MCEPAQMLVNGSALGSCHTVFSTSFITCSLTGCPGVVARFPELRSSSRVFLLERFDALTR